MMSQETSELLQPVSEIYRNRLQSARSRCAPLSVQQRLRRKMFIALFYELQLEFEFDQQEVPF